MPANSWGRGQGVSGRVLREYNFFYVLSCPFTNTVLALNNLYSIYIFVLEPRIMYMVLKERQNLQDCILLSTLRPFFSLLIHNSGMEL